MKTEVDKRTLFIKIENFRKKRKKIKEDGGRRYGEKIDKKRDRLCEIFIEDLSSLKIYRYFR